VLFVGYVPETHVELCTSSDLLEWRTQFQDRIDKRYGHHSLIQTATCLMWLLLDDSLIDSVIHLDCRYRHRFLLQNI
jgi:hypothetical protein